MQVALDGADHDHAAAGLVVGGHVRAQQVEAALHDAGAEQHLGDEAVAAAHALPDHLHAGEQGLVEDLAGVAPVASRACVRAVAVSGLPSMMACLSGLSCHAFLTVGSFDDAVHLLGHIRVDGQGLV